MKGKMFKCPLCGKLSVVRVKCVNGQTLKCLSCHTTPRQWILKWK